MKHPKSFLILLASSIGISSFAGSFSVFVKDDFYQNKDGFDTSKSASSHYVDFGMGLKDIGGSGVSFHSDGLYSNGLTTADVDGITRVTTRQPLQFTTGYLDWINGTGSTGVRIGRQTYTNLAIESFDLDGLKTSFAPAKATRCNAAIGMIVPTPTKNFPLSNFASGNIFTADIANSSLPFTTLTGAFATEKSLQGLGDTRTALGITLEPSSLIQFDGSARFSTAVKGFDHIDGRLSLYPSTAIKTSLFLLSERGRIDSLNYFTNLMFDKITEAGLLFDYYTDANGIIQAGYHFTSIINQGTDHFLFVNAANETIDLGMTFAFGYHGLMVRPKGGLNLALGKYIAFKGYGEYGFFDETDKDDKHQVIVLSAGLKAAFFPIGLTIYPRIEYVTNRYYTKDVRLLLTTSFLIHNYWKSR